MTGSSGMCVHTCAHVYVRVYVVLHIFPPLHFSLSLSLTGFTLNFKFLWVVDCLPKMAPLPTVLSNEHRSCIHPWRHNDTQGDSYRQRTGSHRKVEVHPEMPGRRGGGGVQPGAERVVPFSPSSRLPRNCGLWGEAVMDEGEGIVKPASGRNSGIFGLRLF